MFQSWLARIKPVSNQIAYRFFLWPSPKCYQRVNRTFLPQFSGYAKVQTARSLIRTPLLSKRTLAPGDQHMNKLKWLCFPVSIVTFAIVTAVFPSWWCGLGAEKWFDVPHQQVAFASAFEQQIKSDIVIGDFGTANDQYNGEWLFCTHVLGATGFAQMAIQHPERKEHYMLLMEDCLDKLLEEEMQRFDEKLWGSKAMETLDSDKADHGAYLAYLNFALSLHRSLKPKSRFAETNDRITATLIRRFENSKHWLLQTYRHEVYPADNCLAIASIGLHAKATNTDRSRLMDQIIGSFREVCIDEKSGLMFQSINNYSGKPQDEPRGSGTTFGLYFLSFVDRQLASELYQAAREELAGSVIGFGLMQEYPASSPGGFGDVDSGPVIMNYGVSPTGFMIAGCSVHLCNLVKIGSTLLAAP